MGIAKRPNTADHATRFKRRGISRLPLSIALTIALASRVAATPTEPPADLPPSLRSGCEIDYPPYCLVNADGQADGFSVELLRAALHTMGRNVDFKTGLWSDLKSDLAEGRLDCLPLVGRTPEREAIFDFTFPYLTRQGTIIVRDTNTTILSQNDLRDRQVAVLKGDNAEEFLRKAVPGAIVIPLDSFETALRRLSNGQYDAVVIQKLLALQLIQKGGLTNLRTAGTPLKDFRQDFCFAVRKGDKELLATLNEGLALVRTDGTFRQLAGKWFTPIEAAGRSRSRVIVGGDRNYPPYEYTDRNGVPAGYNVDLTRALARHMGISIDIHLDAWSKVREGLLNGKYDIVEGMFYSVERDREFDFSPPHTIVHHAIVTRKELVRNAPAPFSLDGKRLVVMKGDIMEDWAREQGYADRLVVVSSQEEALQRLAHEEFDCALAAKVPALYWIEQHEWRNLTVLNEPILSVEYCYATLPAKDDLLAQFSEGLAALKTTGEYRDIHGRWLGPYEAAAFPWTTVIRYLLWVAVPLLFLLGVALLWSRSLQRQVEIRTRELNRELAERHRQEAALKLMTRRQERLLAILQKLNTARNLSEVMAVVSVAARKLMEADGAAFILRAGNSVYYADEDAIAPLWKGRSFPLQGGISGWVIANKEPAIIPDIHHDIRIDSALYQSTFVTSMVMVPILIAHPFGAIGVYWAQSHTASRDEVDLLQTLAEATGIVMDNVQLYEDLEQRVQLRTTELELTNKELESFSYSISHDLRAPLRAIDGFTRILQEEYFADADPEAARYLRLVRQNVKQMGELIDDLLKFSRLNRQSIQKEDVNMAELARVAWDELAAVRADRIIDFQIHAPPPCQADAHLLKQVLSNLLANSIKFTRKADNPQIEFSCISAQAYREYEPRHPHTWVDLTRLKADTCLYRIRDNGVGFDMRYADKLFGVFQRLHKADEFEGTGVGLALALRIVTRHGGQIWAEAAVDKGTIVYFHL